MKRGKLFFASLVLLFFGASANVASAGFGITPPYVHNDTLRPGSEFTQEIIIVRSDPTEDLNAELALNLPGIESWFSFDKGLKFLLPKGESQVKMLVTIRVPEDISLGQYKGNIRIRTSSLQTQTTGVSIALGAQIDVQLKVVDKIVDFEVRRVELSEAEEGYEKFWLDFPGKIKFSIHIENTGNVPVAPHKVSMQIYDVTGQQLLETTANTNKIESILPFDTRRSIAYLPTWLPPGAYRIKYSIEKDETRNAQRGELALSILPKGTIAGYESYGFEGLKLSQKLWVLVPSGFIALLLLLSLFYKKRGRHGRKKKHAQDDGPTRHDPPRKESKPLQERQPQTRSGVIDLSRKK